MLTRMCQAFCFECVNMCDKHKDRLYHVLVPNLNRLQRMCLLTQSAITFHISRPTNIFFSSIFRIKVVCFKMVTM